MGKKRPPTSRKKPTAKNALPVIIAALICERVLMEPDNVTSAIRIVDVVNISTDTPPPRGDILGIPLSMLIHLKSGDARGEKEIVLNVVNPSGVREEGAKWKFTFPDRPEGGQNAHMPVLLKWDKEGVYWYEVSVDGVVLMRTPLRVSIATPAAPTRPSVSDRK